MPFFKLFICINSMSPSPLTSPTFVDHFPLLCPFVKLSQLHLILPFFGHCQSDNQLLISVSRSFVQLLNEEWQAFSRLSYFTRLQDSVTLVKWKATMSKKRNDTSHACHLASNIPSKTLADGIMGIHSIFLAFRIYFRTLEKRSGPQANIQHIFWPSTIAVKRNEVLLIFL